MGRGLSLVIPAVARMALAPMSIRRWPLGQQDVWVIPAESGTWVSCQPPLRRTGYRSWDDHGGSRTASRCLALGLLPGSSIGRRRVGRHHGAAVDGLIVYDASGWLVQSRLRDPTAAMTRSSGDSRSVRRPSRTRPLWASCDTRCSPAQFPNCSLRMNQAVSGHRHNPRARRRRDVAPNL